MDGCHFAPIPDGEMRNDESIISSVNRRNSNKLRSNKSTFPYHKKKNP